MKVRTASYIHQEKFHNTAAIHTVWRCQTSWNNKCTCKFYNCTNILQWELQLPHINEMKNI